MRIPVVVVLSVVGAFSNIVSGEPRPFSDCENLKQTLRAYLVTEGRVTLEYSTKKNAQDWSGSDLESVEVMIDECASELPRYQDPRLFKKDMNGLLNNGLRPYLQRVKEAKVRSEEHRINSQRKAQENEEDKRKCLPRLREIGVPDSWLEDSTFLAFSSGYQYPIVDFACALIIKGYGFSYSSGSVMSGPSMTITQPNKKDITITFIEKTVNNVLLILPTSYSGPGGNIKVTNQADLQMIYAQLFQADLK